MADKNFCIKQWLNLGVEIVIFFANLDVGKTLFEHKPVCFIGFVLANFIFFSGMSFLEIGHIIFMLTLYQNTILYM